MIAVVQPHRYTRLSSLFDQFCTCFNDADAVIVAPVYAAGEQPIPGADRDGLVAGLKARGHRNAMALDKVRGSRRPRQGPRAAGRLRDLPRRRQHHPMGLCAAGRARARCRREGGLMFPDHHRRDLSKARRCRSLRGKLGGECADGAAVVVSHGRPGAGAVHAGGRGRSRVFSRRASIATCPGARRRAGLEPARFATAAGPAS